jgi:hypothetical protein
MRGWGKEDVRSTEQERKRSFVWTRPILSFRPDPDDPIYHDQDNDERIDKHKFGGSYVHPNYPSTIFLKKGDGPLFSSSQMSYPCKPRKLP